MLQEEIDELERRLLALVQQTPAMQRLMTLPGVGPILAIVIALELGMIERFARAENFAGYYRWAFIEAANVVALNQKRWRESRGVHPGRGAGRDEVSSTHG